MFVPFNQRPLISPTPQLLATVILVSAYVSCLFQNPHISGITGSLPSFLVVLLYFCGLKSQAEGLIARAVPLRVLKCQGLTLGGDSHLE